MCTLSQLLSSLWKQEFGRELKAREKYRPFLTSSPLFCFVFTSNNVKVQEKSFTDIVHTNWIRAYKACSLNSGWNKKLFYPKFFQIMFWKLQWNQICSPNLLLGIAWQIWNVSSKSKFPNGIFWHNIRKILPAFILQANQVIFCIFPWHQF